MFSCEFYEFLRTPFIGHLLLFKRKYKFLKQESNADTINKLINEVNTTERK